MIKSKRIDSFFKRKACDEDEKNASTSSKIEKLHDNSNIEENEKQLSKVPKVTHNEFENTLERDPEKRLQIWQYPPKKLYITNIIWHPTIFGQVPPLPLTVFDSRINEQKRQKLRERKERMKKRFLKR